MLKVVLGTGLEIIELEYSDWFTAGMRMSVSKNIESVLKTMKQKAF